MINEQDFESPFDAPPKKDEGIELLISNLQAEIAKVEDAQLEASQFARLQELAARYKGEDMLIDSRTLVEIIKSQPPQLQMMTRLPTLDGILSGFRPGQLVSVSAVAKSGKTSFCMELTINQKEFNPTWFPFEEGAEELVAKFLDRGEEPPLFYVPKRIHVRTLKFIETKIIEAITKFDTKIFYIDNLDWIVDPRGSDHERMIQHACMELKRMAVDWNVCIVLIAHVRKLLNPTDQPHYNDIKGSSSVFQLADTVIMLWRETKKENGELIITENVNVSVQLNRKTGKTGNVKLRFINGHYEEYDWHKHDDGYDAFSDKELANARQKGLIK